MFVQSLLILFGLSLLATLSSPSASTTSDNGCISSTGDFDGDGISNEWEEKGIDINNDNIVDANLTNNSNSMHKDIFLELDYMENHRPNHTGITNVINVFKNAPVCNPDEQQGINLHVLVDDMIPHKENILIDCAEAKNILSNTGNQTNSSNWKEVENIKQDYFGTKEDRNQGNYSFTNEARDKIYYYGVFIHQINNVPDSGCAHDNKRLFVISLGNESWWQLDNVIGKDPATNDSKSEPEFQARSLMHELGHTLGLVHGGNNSLNDLNYKPNYLSVMNYLYLFPDERMRQVSFLDYSRCALPDINEVMTEDSKGIDIGNCSKAVANEWIWVGHHEYNNNTASCPPDTMVKFNSQVNWSQNKIPNTIFTDINCDGRNSDVLRGFNDWQNLEYLRN